jgi:hypothetical protein
VVQAHVTEKNRNTLDDRLTNARRVLVTPDRIEKPESRLQVTIALHDGILVYSNLLVWQRIEVLSRDEADSLQSVMDRLKAKLRFFGQGV